METLGVRLRVRRQWRLATLEGGYTWVDKEQTLGTGLESKYVFTQPTHQASVRLHHDLPLGAAAEWQLTRRQRLAPLEDYGLVDLTVSHDLGPGRVQLRVRNLADEEYESIIGVPMPGRWFGLETQVEL
jgi:outer membrane receptor protein involved in Fe transport